MMLYMTTLCSLGTSFCLGYHHNDSRLSTCTCLTVCTSLVPLSDLVDGILLCCWIQAQLIAQSIGQAFSVAYQEFLRANGINPEDLSQKEYSDIINTQEMYNDDLIHFSNSENCKEVSLV